MSIQQLSTSNPIACLAQCLRSKVAPLILLDFIDIPFKLKNPLMLKENEKKQEEAFKILLPVLKQNSGKTLKAQWYKNTDPRSAKSLQELDKVSPILKEVVEKILNLDLYEFFPSKKFISEIEELYPTIPEKTGLIDCFERMVFERNSGHKAGFPKIQDILKGIEKEIQDKSQELGKTANDEKLIEINILARRFSFITNYAQVIDLLNSRDIRKIKEALLPNCAPSTANGTLVKDKVSSDEEGL